MTEISNHIARSGALHPHVWAASKAVENAAAAPTPKEPGGGTRSLQRGCECSLAAAAAGRRRDAQAPVRDDFVRETPEGSGPEQVPAEAPEVLIQLADAANHPVASMLAQEFGALLGRRSVLDFVSARSDRTGLKVAEARDGTPVYFVRSGRLGRPAYVTKGADGRRWQRLSRDCVARVNVGWVLGNTCSAMVELAEARRATPAADYGMHSLPEKLKRLFFSVED